MNKIRHHVKSAPMKHFVITSIFCFYALSMTAQDNLIMLGFGRGFSSFLPLEPIAIEAVYQHSLTPHLGGRITLGTYSGRKDYDFYSSEGIRIGYIPEKERLTYIDWNLYMSLLRNRRKLNLYLGTGFSLFQSTFQSVPNGTVITQIDNFKINTVKNRHRSAMINTLLVVNLKVTKDITVELSNTFQFEFHFSSQKGIFRVGASLDFSPN
jgi:hypothetical protein